MKKRITLILVLMSSCVTGITCLQLYWNYQNYNATVKTFKHDTNEAFEKAIDREMEWRRGKILGKFKGWLADTSIVTITTHLDGLKKSTVFNIRDTHPYYLYRKNKGMYFGISDFKEQVPQITPKARLILINFMVDSMVKRDLGNGTVYYYTPHLGDSLTKVVEGSRCNTTVLTKFYKEELLSRSVDASFIINPNKTNKDKRYLTRTVSAGLQRPYQKDMVFAAFESPGAYFLKQMKWLLMSSLLLIGITIFCFGYTVKTILTQQKLAVLKNDFVNNMTHELKTPIATINIAAEAIKDFNLSRASADEYLDIIRYQAGNLTNLVDQILKNVASEQETETLNLTATNVSKLISDIVKEYKPQAAAANVTVNYKSGTDKPGTMADESLLKTAIANLLDNAIKYGGQGAIVNIDEYTQNNSVAITVTDNGPGIPQQYQDKVFDRFFRVPVGDIHNVKGYGLGLSYARSIIQRHKGTLSLISKEGEGTQFIISIPLIYHEASQGTIA
ncbi:MAG: HAMP domain-containing sensor histidine kinase [Bacteroidota bacterium]